MESPSLDSYLIKLKEQYKKTIPEKLSRVKQLIGDLQKQPSKDSLSALRAEVHKIAGNAGTYGYHEVSALCKDFESHLIHILREAEKTSSPSYSCDEKKSEKFYESLELLFQNESSAKQDTSIVSQPQVPQKPVVLIVDSDAHFLELIEKQKEKVHFQIVTQNDPEKGLDALSKGTIQPAMIIAARQFAESSLTAYDFFEAKKSIPYGLLIEEEDMSTRLEAIEHNVNFIFKKPVAIEKFLSIIESKLQNMIKTGYKILVVDDDPDICNYLTNHFISHGIDCKSLYSGEKIFEVLKEYLPDVLLLDIHLPNYDGFSLLKAIRNDSLLKNLSIVIITGSNESQLFEQAYAKGADDFIQKPFDDAVFMKRVLRILERSKILRNDEKEDSTTGLDSKEAFISKLKLLKKAEKESTIPKILVFLQIDYFTSLQTALTSEEIRKLLLHVTNYISTMSDPPQESGYLEDGRFGLVFHSLDTDHVANQVDQLLKNITDDMGGFASSPVAIAFSAGLTQLKSIEKSIADCQEALLEAQSCVKKKYALRVRLEEKEGAIVKNEVCLIEDDPDLIQLISYSLKSNGLHCNAFSTGKEALDFLNQLDVNQLPLILSDRLLPDMDGLDIFRKLKMRFGKNVKVIFMTTLSNEKDVMEGLKETPLDYITKPLNIPILVQKVKNFFALPRD